MEVQGKDAKIKGYILLIFGAPGRIRTCDLRIRSPLLYPTELQALFFNFLNGGMKLLRPEEFVYYQPYPEFHSAEEQ